MACRTTTFDRPEKQSHNDCYLFGNIRACSFLFYLKYRTWGLDDCCGSVIYNGVMVRYRRITVRDNTIVRRKMENRLIRPESQTLVRSYGYASAKKENTSSLRSTRRTKRTRFNGAVVTALQQFRRYTARGPTSVWPLIEFQTRFVRNIKPLILKNALNFTLHSYKYTRYIIYSLTLRRHRCVLHRKFLPTGTLCFRTGTPNVSARADWKLSAFYPRPRIRSKLKR